VIWIDGELEGIAKASQAINIIDQNPQIQGLTDKIREFLGVYETETPETEIDAGEEHERQDY